MECWIDIKTKEKIIEEGLNKFPLETGGILCGYRTENDDYVITCMVGPGPNAHHSPIDFEGNNKWQSEEFLKLWERSNETLCYLGDWHTHPNGPAYASELDKKCIRGIAHREDTKCPNPIMIIIGDAVNDFKVHCYHEDRFIELNLYEFDYEKYVYDNPHLNLRTHEN